MKAYIKGIAYYLPEAVLTNEELVEQFPEWTVDKISKKVGISERHITTEDETAGDLAVKAAEKLFSERNIDRSQIDFVLLCTQSPDYHLPSTSCIIQDRLGLSTKCGAFDFNLGCSGYEYGLAVAKGLVLGGIANNILLLTAETYTKYIHPLDKGNRTIFGDGATATLVSNEGFAEICEFGLGTDGSGAEQLIVKTGCARQFKPANDYQVNEECGVHSSDNLYMNGKAIFDFTADVVPRLIEETLQKNGITMDDVDLFVFHQANKYMINYIRKLMDIEKDKFFIFMENVGNTVSSTIPIALCEAEKEGRLKGKVVLAGFGVGLSYGAVVLNIR
ncbi:MAG: ketoacyl-ACP synthase III [Bacteroidaceae bacterium]|nr:ketoacyl-ACP synthase III [Bacteroidaceae bacterium]